MHSVKIAEFRNDMADPINRAAYGGERVLLTRHGKGVVALVGLDDLALLERLEDEADLKAAEEARREGGKPIPWETIKAELKLRGLNAVAGAVKKRKPRGTRKIKR